MLKRMLILIVFSLLSFSFIPFSLYMDKDKLKDELRVRDGVLDLSAWDYKVQQRIPLDGEWEFYWDRLLPPEFFQQRGPERSADAAKMKVPSIWKGKVLDGRPLPAYGSATYRMTLKNVPVDGVFAIKKTNVRFSSTIYVNGVKLFEDGVPSGEAASYRPGNVPQIAFFSADRGDVEIVVHAANYDYVNAGIPSSLYFGEQEAMMDYQQRSMAREFSMMAILGTMALIYFICFVTAALYRNKDYSLLAFSIICSIYALYTGLTGERSLLSLFPGLSFETAYKLKDLCSIVWFIVLAVFVRQLDKNVVSLKLGQIVLIAMSGFLFLIAFAPIRVYSVFQAYVILLYELLLIWLLLRMAYLYIRSRPGKLFKALLLFMAILCINLYSVSLILFAVSIKENLWLGQFYIVVFNIILIFLVVLRFFEAYHTVDQMKNQLLQLDKIKDDFLSNTSHELKTPLNAIVNITDTLLKGVEGPLNEKQAQNLAIVIGSGKRLTHIVNELLDYSKMKHGDILLYQTSVDLKAAVDSVIRIHLFLLGGKRIRLVNEIPNDFPDVYADGNRLIQILHNLIGNAVKFTEEGTVTVSAEGDAGQSQGASNGYGDRSAGRAAQPNLSCVRAGGLFGDAGS